MKSLWTAALCLALLVACSKENTSGVPETDTTATNAQSVQQTSPETASTTGVTGGTVSNTTPDDKEFVSKAGMGGLAEVQMGNLALQKAQSADVKAFGQRMVTDHSKANAELAQLATAKGLALPTEVAGEHQAAMQHLQSLSGAEFDKAYMTHMVEDHEKDVAEFDKASTSASDAEIKAFAGKTLPVLREHLALAKTTAGKV
jgi:putative membrane protein